MSPKDIVEEWYNVSCIKYFQIKYCMDLDEQLRHEVERLIELRHRYVSLLKETLPEEYKDWNVNIILDGKNWMGKIRIRKNGEIKYLYYNGKWSETDNI